MGIAGIANQIDLLLTLFILTIGIDIVLKLRHVDAEKMRKRALTKEGLQVLWMDSTMLGAAFIVHQLLWALEVFFSTDTGLWFDATKTIFIASLGFVTLTWRMLIKDTLEQSSKTSD